MNENNSALGSLGEKKNLVTGLVVVSIMLSAFLLVKTFNEIKNEGEYPQTNIISVTGKSEIMIVPDVASFSVSVQEDGATVVAAQQKATDKNNKVLAFLKEKGIEEKDIKTTSYNINPKYEYQQTTPCTPYNCPPGKSVITGYEVSQTTEVKVRDTAKSGEILSGVGSLAVSNVSGLNFTVDDIEKVKDQAREEAIADARAKAKQLSKNLGVRLGDITGFYEEMPYPYYDKAMNASIGMGGEMREQAIAAPEISVGENKITSQVSIMYEIK